MTDDATPAKARLTDGLGPAAWAVMAFGRVQALAVRADVADELACKWREQDPNADALPLYGPADILARLEAVPMKDLDLVRGEVGTANFVGWNACRAAMLAAAKGDTK